MGGHKRTKQQREEELVWIAEMHGADLSQREITAALSLSQVQICKDLKEIYRRWAAGDKTTLPVLKARLLAEIRGHKRLARKAWSDSLNPKRPLPRSK